MTDQLKGVIIGVYVLFGWSILLGQSHDIRFQHLTTENGLPQNMVDCMLQDEYGFLWIGTWNGLCRYDGYDFEVFDEIPGSKFDNNFIYSLEKGPHGNIWIGTRQGLQVYVYSQLRFHPVNISGLNLAGIRDIEIYQDSILVVGSEMGLTFLTFKNASGEVQLLKHYTFGSSALKGTTINTVLADSREDLWVGTDAGVFNYSLDKLPDEKANPLKRVSNVSVYKIYESENKDIWIGTETGLIRYRKRDESIKEFQNIPGDNQSLIHSTVMDIHQTNDGNLMLATLGGLSIFDPSSESFSSYKNEINNSNSLSNDFVNCLLEDDEGNIWIGTERGGINYLITNQNRIEHYEFRPDDKNSLSVSTVNSVYEDEEYLWIGTAGGGLNRYNKSNGTYRYYRSESDNPSTISSDFITGIIKDKSGRLWVSTWGSGINMFNENTQTFTRYEGESYLVNDFVSSITEDKLGNLWIGTLGGISRLDIRNDKFEVIVSDSTSQRVSQVGCLLFDADNSLWVGTRHGLFHITSENSSFEELTVRKYIHMDNDPASISGNYIISILKDHSGQLWFGTYGQGLNKLLMNEGQVNFESYTTADGLGNTIIYGIVQDKNDQLWLTTDYGLSQLDPRTGRVRNFYQADGLLNNQYYWSAAYKNDDGKLYFGGMNGLDAFYPEWIREEKNDSEVIITEIKLLNETVLPGKEYNGLVVLDKAPFKAKRIDLSYEEKVLSVEFSALNFQESDMIQYAYILEGFEEEWNYVSSNRRFASYTNLKPGDYTFKVKASTSNERFNGPSTDLLIHIDPPFWETTWFRRLSFVTVLMIVIGYVKFRTYSLKRQKRILEKQVRERTEKIKQQNEALSFQAVQLQKNNSDLEDKQKLIAGQNLKLEGQNKEILDQRDKLIKLNEKLKLVSQLKLSFFTNISHEFRTPLTLIIGPIEKLLKEQNLSREAKSTLDVMNRNAQRLLHLINQIMDFRKIEKGRMDLKVSKGDIGEFTKRIFEAFRPLSEIRQIDFQYEAKELPSEVWFDKDKLENILYNLLSNAFKYSKNGGEVRVVVSCLSAGSSRLKSINDLAEVSDVISIKVIDTGVGISEENLPLVFKRFYRIESEEAFKISGSGIGLALTEELIKTHHGEIFVESKLNEGSTFEIQIPSLKEAYKSDGTTDQSSSINIHEQVALLKNEFMAPEDVEEANDQVVDKDQSTVLVVEDNNDLRKFITHRLRKNYHILEAMDGAEGIKLAEAENPDVIISDVMMPNVDGLELCGRLKNNLNTSHIPIILLTAKSSVENQIEGLQIGADDYLAKPFNFDLLEARVQNLIKSRAKLQKIYRDSSDISVKEITTSTQDEKFLTHAIDTVKESMKDSSFGAKEFVTKMGISKSLLHQKLTKLTGQSAGEFINHLRMIEAKRLLETKSLNISEVAYKVGYNDPKYFSRLFSKLFGLSPSEYASSSMVES